MVDSYSFATIGAMPLSSLSPYYDIPLNESIFSEFAEPIVLDVVNSEIDVISSSWLVKDLIDSSPDCLNKRKNCTLAINPALIENFRAVNSFNPVVNEEYLPCNEKNPSPEFSKLCNALRFGAIEKLYPNVQYPTKICHSPNDEISFFSDIPAKFPENKFLSLKPTVEQWQNAEKIMGTINHPFSALQCQSLAAIDIARYLTEEENRKSASINEG